MATITGTQIVANLRFLLQDEDAVPRYEDSEILPWLNEGTLAVCRLIPGESVTINDLTLAAGVQQSLPAGALSLRDIKRNKSSGNNAVSMVSRSALDAFEPGWQGLTQTADIKHYMPDLNDPLRFAVYPPALPGTIVEAEYATVPAVTTSLAETIKVKDIYAPALTNYIAYRLYSKDDEDAANAAAAVAYYNAFMAALGLGA